jgi:hypothetical protein
LRLFRALLGGAGLAGCVGLLAGQARADIVQFVPVRSAPEAAISKADEPSPAGTRLVPTAERPAKDTSRPTTGRGAECDGHRVAMAPARVRGPH